MTFAFFLAGTTEGYSLIERDIRTKFCGFANNKAHTMVDKKSGSKSCSGVDIDTGQKSENVLSSRGISTQPFGIIYALNGGAR